MSHHELREKFLDFFKKHDHAIVSSSSLLSEDPSVLLTTAGMQQFKPYFVGAADPQKDFGSKNAASIQKSFRTSDIDEVGDESHLTFFEMLGNFSFGGYFKEEAIKYAYEFITKELNLPIEYVTIFEGNQDVPKDEDSYKIWKSIDSNIEVRESGREDNFWGPTGVEGPCGPTTEIYIKNSKSDAIEVWNIVFNEFYCARDKSLKKLETPGVDTGMGLERLAMIAQDTNTIFETDLFSSIIQSFPREMPERTKRIMADHIRGITFLVSDDVRPSNKEAGYILRRLIRRVVFYAQESVDVEELFSAIVEFYIKYYPELNLESVKEEYSLEKERFTETLERGLKELEKLEVVDAKSAFYIFSTHGLPYEVIREVGGDRVKFSREEFENEFSVHQDVSRAGTQAKFKGGLADHSPRTIKLHTAHHLLLAALQKVLGGHVKQRGSNITSERLRIDFSHGQKVTPQELGEVESLVNKKIQEDLKVVRKEMPREEAEKIGAQMEFGAKYGDIVSIYFIEDEKGNIFSKEFCGGPHVSRTGKIGKFKIKKEESASAGIRRIKAIIE